ncbi:DUF305 domain-containing protein [Pradoshia sp.]
MRRRIQTACLVMFAWALCMNGAQAEAKLSQNEKDYYEDYQSILDVMKKGMEEAPETGDPSLDFLYEMIPHHEAAVSMAENVLKYGQNEKVKQLADAIIKEQLSGIKKMEDLEQQLKSNPKDNKLAEKSYLKAYKAIYQRMITSMEAAKPTGNIDKDFLEEMIPHHEGAINMAANILKYTDNNELKAIAQHIIDTQQKQVNEMKALLTSIQ